MPEHSTNAVTENFPVTDFNRVVQAPESAEYDRATIFNILDHGLVAHLSFVDRGRPIVLPMTYGREGERLFLHGARTSRLMAAISGKRVCIAVTLVDGIVVGRSIFESSLNYRSVAVHGQARDIISRDEKSHALWTISEHNFPGRWDEVRPLRDTELQETAVMEVKIDAASAKIRSGPPTDSDESYDPYVWAGVVPISTVIGSPAMDSKTAGDAVVPRSLSRIQLG
jgi:uncharacterized protein